MENQQTEKEQTADLNPERERLLLSAAGEFVHVISDTFDSFFKSRRVHVQGELVESNRYAEFSIAEKNFAFSEALVMMVAQLVAAMSQIDGVSEKQALGAINQAVLRYVSLYEKEFKKMSEEKHNV